MGTKQIRLLPALKASQEPQITCGKVRRSLTMCKPHHEEDFSPSTSRYLRLEKSDPSGGRVIDRPLLSLTKKSHCEVLRKLSWLEDTLSDPSVDLKHVATPNVVIQSFLSLPIDPDEGIRREPRSSSSFDYYEAETVRENRKKEARQMFVQSLAASDADPIV